MTESTVISIATVLVIIGGFWDNTRKSISRHDKVIDEMRAELVAQGKILAGMEEQLKILTSKL